MKKQRKALSLVLVVAMILSMFAMAIPGVSAAEDVLNGKVIGILGDADQSEKIDIKDATHIQKAVADVVTLSDEQQILANVDGGKLTVNDATWIQKYVAGYDCSALGIGKNVVLPDEQPTVPVEPTEPTAVTTAPVDPTEPEQTTAPVDPTEPEQTTAPVDPTEPEQTTAPVDPTEPEQTTAPVDPTEPEQTTAPVDPTEPEQTTAPVDPTVPEQTTVPVDPTDPTEGTTVEDTTVEDTTVEDTTVEDTTGEDGITLYFAGQFPEGKPYGYFVENGDGGSKYYYNPVDTGRTYNGFKVYKQSGIVDGNYTHIGFNDVQNDKTGQVRWNDIIKGSCASYSGKLFYFPEGKPAHYAQAWISDWEFDVEDTTAEDTTAEDTTVEDTTVEDTTVEDTTDATPGEATPGEATPDEATPDEATPDEATPDEATPDEATPDEATPDEATPDESKPDESKPEDTTDEDGITLYFAGQFPEGKPYGYFVENGDGGSKYYYNPVDTGRTYNGFKVYKQSGIVDGNYTHIGFNDVQNDKTGQLRWNDIIKGSCASYSGKLFYFPEGKPADYAQAWISDWSFDPEQTTV